MKNKFYYFLGFAISILLLSFLFQRVDTDEFLVRIKGFWEEGRLWGLLVCSLVYPLLQGLRFSIIYPGKASLAQHLGLNFANHTGNILIPGRVGEAVRPLYIKRWWPDTPLKEVIGWSLFEKGGEFISMLIFIAVGLLLFESSSPLKWQGTNFQLMSIVTILVAVSAAAALLRKASKGATRKSEKLFWTIHISFLTWCVNTLGVFAITGDMRLSFALLVTMTLASSIPLLPAGMGATQWAAVALGSLVQMAEADALAYSSAIHLVWIFVRLAIGLPLLFWIWGWPQAREIDAVRKAEAVTS